MNTWTPEMAKTSIVLAVLLMAIAVYVFRKDRNANVRKHDKPRIQSIFGWGQCW